MKEADIRSPALFDREVMSRTVSELLESALREVLMCPGCGGTLQPVPATSAVACVQCGVHYPYSDGILCFMQRASNAQSAELSVREELMRRHHDSDGAALMNLVARHHCISVMSRRAANFRMGFEAGDWILDIGAGTGWYWSKTRGARLILLDFSKETLRSARRLLGPETALFVEGDVRHLPIRPATLAGAWSVQLFQHLPPETLSAARFELARTLRRTFRMEIYNLNPALVHRLIYRLAGRRMHLRGMLGEMLLNRFSAAEWRAIWVELNGRRPHISHGYSELFFHPNFGLRPGWYPRALERFFTTLCPSVAGLFARQVHLVIASAQTESTEPDKSTEPA